MEHGHCLQMHTLYMNHRIQMSKQKPTANQIETHICKLKQPIPYPSRKLKSAKIRKDSLEKKIKRHDKTAYDETWPLSADIYTPYEPPDPDELTKTHCKPNWNSYVQAQATHS